jgi:hypothetical protein
MKVGGESAPPSAGHQGMPPPPPPQRGVPQAESPRAAPRKAGSGINGGVLVSHLST